MLDIPRDTAIPIGVVNNAYKDIRQRAEAAVRTTAILQGEGYTQNDDVLPGNFHDLTHRVLTAVAEDKQVPLNIQTKLTGKALAAQRTNAILDEYDHQIVNSAVRIRNYVTNRLLEESTHPDANIRIRALIQLGKISDVGLFVEKSEVVTKNRNDSEIVELIRKKLATLSGGDVSDAKVVGDVVTE